MASIDTAGDGGGRNCLSHSSSPLYVYVCSLLSFSPVIVPKSLPDNVSKELLCSFIPLFFVRRA